ncbi:MAG: bifunctional phosphoglucose/phosphomannose isomerase [Armatimonadetes bacterium]|nr:MAG: bifunctional phosphoglucose/phosphomannose isomerase [Armatimonadota bacterium]
MPEQLDSREFVLRADPRGMFGLAEAFPKQCREALELSERLDLDGVKGDYRNIVVCGMGGSAAGGDLLGCLLSEEGAIPSFTVRDYALPKWVGPDSLVVACSYSGNTEETLSATEEAIRRGCQVVCITSGGALAERAKAARLPLLQIPGGQPPRTALGYLFVPLVQAAVGVGALPEQPWDEALSVLESCLTDWGLESSGRRNAAKRLATRLYGNVPLLYGLGSWQGVVASRWKGQLNENAKCMAFANTFPELNHNEIVGWTLAETQVGKRWTVVILEDGTESARMQARARITRELIEPKAQTYTVTARGESLVSRILSLVYMADFVSLYLAALYGVDPYEIAAIDTLKRSLAEL